MFYGAIKAVWGIQMNVFSTIEHCVGKKQGIKRLGLPIALRTFVF